MRRTHAIAGFCLLVSLLCPTMPVGALDLLPEEMLDAGRYREARGAVLDLARDGHPGAAYVVAESYARPTGAERDMAQALAWYRRSAEAGWAFAWIEVGRILMSADGVPQDAAAAADALRRAVADDWGEAAFLLGLMWRDGVGTTPAPYRALKRFEQAGDLYWPEGYLEGGRFAAFGFHKARDCKTADRLLRAALREELYEAATLLGRLHQGDGVCPSDRDRAIRFFRMGERVRDADATLGLGRALMRRSGDPEASFDPERDRREAVHYLALALSRGDARARPWLDWAIAGVEPPLSPEELAEIRGLQILLDGGGYDLPEGTPPRPNARQG